MDASEGRATRSDPASPPERLHTPDPLEFGDLSQFFNPFLPQFVRDALTGGGEVWVTRDAGRVDGLLLYHDTERVGSIFTRSRSRAEELRALHQPVAVFSEFPLTPSVEVYSVWETRGATVLREHRYVHPVRGALRTDLPEVGRLLRETYGRFDPRWLEVTFLPGTRCLVIDVGGQIAGAAWVSVAGREGRLYSLTVRPRFRRVGVGTDLWYARTTWAARSGATRVISEISEQNVPSMRIAERGGMRRIGALYLSRTPGVPQVRGAPQLGQTLSVTSMRFPQ